MDNNFLDFQSVVISKETWETKYLPLFDAYKQLKEELESKQIRVVLVREDLGSNYCNWDRELLKFGYVDLSVEKPTVVVEDQERLDYAINQMFSTKWYMGIEKRVLTNELADVLSTMIIAECNYLNEHNTRLVDILVRVPKWLRRLLGIQKILNELSNNLPTSKIKNKLYKNGNG